MRRRLGRLLQTNTIETKATDTTNRVILDLGLTSSRQVRGSEIHARRSPRRACGDVYALTRPTGAKNLAVSQ